MDRRVSCGCVLSMVCHATRDFRRCVQDGSFESIYKDLFIQFLASVPPWFTLDINQGVLSVYAAKTSPCLFAAEVYGFALGEDVRDDF
jgi:hypothetical protein